MVEHRQQTSCSTTRSKRHMRYLLLALVLCFTFLPMHKEVEAQPTAPQAAASLTKRLVNPTSGRVEIDQEMVFEIKISNTGSKRLDVIPLGDSFDPTYLRFVRASVNGQAADPDQQLPNLIAWNDLTQLAHVGDLAPGDSITIQTTFLALAATEAGGGLSPTTPSGPPGTPLPGTVTAYPDVGEAVRDVVPEARGLAVVELVPVPVRVRPGGVACLGTAGDVQRTAAGPLEGLGTLGGGEVELFERRAGGDVAVRAIAGGRPGDAHLAEHRDRGGVTDLRDGRCLARRAEDGDARSDDQSKGDQDRTESWELQSLHGFHVRILPAGAKVSSKVAVQVVHVDHDGCLRASARVRTAPVPSKADPIAPPPRPSSAYRHRPLISAAPYPSSGFPFTGP